MMKHVDAHRRTIGRLPAPEMVRVAAFPPPPPPPHGGMGDMDEGGGGTGARNIPKNHEYNPKALKPLAKMLWAMSVSLGHALTAYRQFTKLKSSTISPDGRLGGRGYVMDVREVRKRLYDACESLSAISDTIHDEIQAPHWKPKLEQLTRDDQQDVERYVGKAEEELDKAEDEIEAIDDDEDDEDRPAFLKNRDEKDSDDDDEEGSSQIPDGGDAEMHEVNKTDPLKSKKTKTASETFWTGDLLRKIASVRETLGVIANSSLPVTTLPGPRVEHLDRGNEPGPWGSWNREEEPSDDKYDYRRREHDYVSDYENEPTDKDAARMGQPIAESAMPGTLTDKTRTDADDFGIGSNSDPATGGGLEHTPAPPSGKGVWGPSSELPDDPGGKMKDTQTPADGADIEVSLKSRNVWQASEIAKRVELRMKQAAWEAPRPVPQAVMIESSYLPNDNSEPVARSDYYQGEKGNTVSQSGMPGTGMPAKETPLVQRPLQDESVVGESEMPGDNTNAPLDSDRLSLPHPGTVEEPDSNTPYIRWDDTTHQYRQDGFDQYQYSRPKNARTSDV